ncbi:TRAP transporter small permease [Azospirillum sp. ST 5-10]|uniref:TRAP transporter small permease n=1 Tax=unclassified Azospirillum TaxID=2630922 RepID=UPI003F4A600F
MNPFCRGVSAASNAVVRVERVLGGALGLAVALLILLNVVTRSLDMALYWVDEAAVYAMVWLGFVGASLTVRLRAAVAVTLLWDMLPPELRHPVHVAADACVLLMALALAVMTWNWFDPPGLAAAGFDLAAFSGDTFNFIYQTRTTTLGIPKFLVWLVVPWTAATLTLHAVANLAETLARAPSAVADAAVGSLE